MNLFVHKYVYVCNVAASKQVGKQFYQKIQVVNKRRKKTALNIN